MVVVLRSSLSQWVPSLLDSTALHGGSCLRSHSLRAAYPRNGFSDGVSCCSSNKISWSGKTPLGLKSRSKLPELPRCVSSSSSDSNTKDSEPPSNKDKKPFGYTRKDVLLIGLGVTMIGFGLKYGLEFVGVDPLQAGNVVQLVLVLGLTVGWIATYIFRVSNKDMTYAQQLRDYEYKVMEKRLEGLTEAELQVLMEQVEEEKRRLANGEQV